MMHAGIANKRFSLKSAAGENVPGIPGACATCNFTYLVRGPLISFTRAFYIKEDELVNFMTMINCAPTMMSAGSLKWHCPYKPWIWATAQSSLKHITSTIWRTLHQSHLYHIQNGNRCDGITLSCDSLFISQSLMDQKVGYIDGNYFMIIC